MRQHLSFRKHFRRGNADPGVIVACLEGGIPTRTSGSSVYPAVQNMLESSVEE